MGQRQPWSPIPDGVLPAHGKLEGYVDLSGEYRLPAGAYTVKGYVCGILDGPECFMTNTIKLNLVE
jgi:hypothetical protein